MFWVCLFFVFFLFFFFFFLLDLFKEIDTNDKSNDLVALKSL